MVCIFRFEVHPVILKPDNLPESDYQDHPDDHAKECGCSTCTGDPG